MRIGVFSNLYPPYVRGGAEGIATVIVHELERQQHEVFVVTTKVSHGDVNERGIYRIPSFGSFFYWRIGEQSIFSRALWHVQNIWSMASYIDIRAILEEEKPDAVMTHNLMGIGLAAVRAIRESGAVHLHTLHDVQLFYPSGKLPATTPENPFASLYARATRRIIGSPDIVISPSQWLLDEHTRRGFFYESKKIVLQNPSLGNATSLPSYKRHDPIQNLLYVGQLEKHKGILFLLDALRRYQRQTTHCPLTLDVVGDGSLRAYVEHLAFDMPSVTIHGNVRHAEISHFYERADALVVPSLVHENQPTVILEAQRHALPVIAARVGGIPEMMKEGENGALFAPNNADDFHRALATVPSMYTRMQSNSEASLTTALTTHEYVEILLRWIS
jgi:glycosyltransferase involved in cell wall biosynthesis